MSTPHIHDALGCVLVETAMPEESLWTTKAAGLIPRGWLARIVEDFTRDPQGSGILLITGGPGTGKTGFFHERLEKLSSENPVAHFISAEHRRWEGDPLRWDNPEAFFDSLSAQLRRKHRLGPPTPPEARWHDDPAVCAAQKFLALLHDVSRHLQGCSPQRREVIWIDALNTAYGESARHFSAGDALHELSDASTIRGEKMLTLPPGIYLVLTSSDGPHLKKLRPRCAEIVNLHARDRQKDINKEIDDYFWSRGFRDDLRRKAAVKAVEGNFLFARFWVDAVLGNEPAAQPKNSAELLELVFLRVAEQWQKAADLATTELAAIEVLDNFGLLACTREPLTVSLIQKLFDPARADLLQRLCNANLPLTEFDEDSRLRFTHGYIAEFLLRPDDHLPEDSHIRRLRRQLSEKLRLERPLQEGDLVRTWHAELADACNRGKENALGFHDAGKPVPDDPVIAYSLRNLCSHLRRAGEWDRLAGELTDPRFLLVKLGTGRSGIFDLLYSLKKALDGTPKMPDDHQLRAAVRAVLLALRPRPDAIAEDPFVALQQIRNETAERGSVPLPGPEAADPLRPLELRDQPWYARLCDAMEKSGRCWLETPRPSAQAGHRPRRVLRHRNTVLALAFAPPPEDSRAPAPAGTEHRTHMLASIGADHRLRLWKDNYEPPMRIRLPGATSDDTAAADGTVAERGKTTFPPTGLAFVLDGKRIAIATRNGIILLDPRAKDFETQDPSDALEVAAGVIKAGFVHCLASASSVVSPASPASLRHSLVLVGRKDGSAQVIDILTGRDVATLAPGDKPAGRRRSSGKAASSRQSAGKEGDDPAEEEPVPVDNYCCVALSHDGTLAAVAHADQTISVWELDIADYLACLEKHLTGIPEYRRTPVLKVLRRLHHLPATADRRADSLAFSPCGKILAVGGGFRRGVVELWRLDRHDCICFSAHRNAAWALAFALDPSPSKPDTLLITGSFDRTVGIWKLSDILHAEERARGRFVPRTMRGAGEDEASYTILDLPDPLTPTARMYQHDVVTTLAVSYDSTLLATGGTDDAVHVWNIPELLGKAPSNMDVSVNPNAGFLHAGAFDPKGRLLATGGEDGSFHIWDVATGKSVGFAGLGGPAIRSLRFSADGLRLAVGTESTFLHCYLHENGDIRSFEKESADSAIFAIAFAPDAEGRAHFTGNRKGLIVPRSGARPVPDGHRHQLAVRALGFSTDGRWLASAGDDDNLIITDLFAENGTTRPFSRQHLSRVKSLAFSKDQHSRWLATGGHETIRIWSTETWTVVAILHGHRDEIWALDFSPDGRFLASGSKDATARVWDLATHRQLCCLPCSNAVFAVQFGPESSVELRVADAGPGGGSPNIYTATLRGVPPAEDPA